MQSKTYFLGTLTLVLFLFNLQQANGANILGVFTSHSPSHLIVHMSVVKALAEKGHNVTVISGLKPKVMHESIRNIVIPPSEEHDKLMETIISNMTTQSNSIFALIKHFLTQFQLFIDMQVNILNDRRFTSLYDNPNEKFDLVIWGYFMNEFELGVAAKFKAPIILNWMGPTMSFIDKYFGNPEEISYVPNMNIPLKIGDRMSFSKRVQNFVMAYIFKGIGYLHSNKMASIYRQLFPSDNFPSYDEMRKNISLAFCNSHFSEGPIRPNVPAVIEIGGIQVKDKPDPLPKEIAEFLNNSQSKKHGAILFSLGSNVKSSNVRAEVMQNIFTTLSALKQTVIWKWEDLENTPGKSNNILYSKWLPQDDILAHPNLKLFITHAGKGGVAEAQYHGVPMVALPIFGDQNGNAGKIVDSGYGLQLPLQTMSKNDFNAAVLEVLENPVYAQNVKQFSQLYRDRPLTAKENVVYWAEYVIRHHGAAHLQSPLVHLSFIEALNLDIYLILLVLLVVIIKISKFVIKFIWKKICKKNSEKSKSKRKIKQK